jgi:hypothetical protein
MGVEANRLLGGICLAGLITCLVQIDEGLLPHFPHQRVMGQDFDMLVQAVRSIGLQGFQDLRVESPPPPPQQAAVDHFMGKRVLEGQGALGQVTGFVEKLQALQV